MDFGSSNENDKAKNMTIKLIDSTELNKKQILQEIFVLKKKLTTTFMLEILNFQILKSCTSVKKSDGKLKKM